MKRSFQWCRCSQTSPQLIISALTLLPSWTSRSVLSERLNSTSCTLFASRIVRHGLFGLTLIEMLGLSLMDASQSPRGVSSGRCRQTVPPSIMSALTLLPSWTPSRWLLSDATPEILPLLSLLPESPRLPVLMGIHASKLSLNSSLASMASPMHALRSSDMARRVCLSLCGCNSNLCGRLLLQPLNTSSFRASESLLSTFPRFCGTMAVSACALRSSVSHHFCLLRSLSTKRRCSLTCLS